MLRHFPRFQADVFDEVRFIIIIILILRSGELTL